MFKYEHKKAPLLPKNKFYKRLFINLLLAAGIILISLAIGICGYMSFANLPFVIALENASMILGGMGPVDHLTSDAAKYFASFYALFSGIAFLSMVAVFMAPFLHRFLHAINLDPENDSEIEEGEN